METESETLEKIADMGIPKGFDSSEYKRKFKFRVTFKAKARDSAKAQESSFSYYDLATARRCYRDILLAFYKGKEIESFAICLNHYGSKKWEKPIHLEAVSEGS